MRTREIVAHHQHSQDRSSCDPASKQAGRRQRFMRRSLDGRGWKSATPRRRRRRRPNSPGPPPILWSSSARTDRPLAALPVPVPLPPLLLAPCTASLPPPPADAGPFRCRLQRNDPGWFVGEQRHVIFLVPAAAAEDLRTLAAEEVEQGAEAMVVPSWCACSGVLRVAVAGAWAAAFIRDATRDQAVRPCDCV
jgi:hypothetical protein